MCFCCDLLKHCTSCDSCWQSRRQDNNYCFCRASIVEWKWWWNHGFWSFLTITWVQKKWSIHILLDYIKYCLIYASCCVFDIADSFNNSSNIWHTSFLSCYCYLHDVCWSKELIFSSNLLEMCIPYRQSVLICLKMCVLVCLKTCWGCWISEQLCLKIFFLIETLCQQINQTLITTVFIHNLSAFMCLDDHFIHQPWHINQTTTIVDLVCISFWLLVVSESFSWFFVGLIKSIRSSNSFLYLIKTRISLSRTFIPGSLGYYCFNNALFLEPMFDPCLEAFIFTHISVCIIIPVTANSDGNWYFSTISSYPFVKANWLSWSCLMSLSFLHQLPCFLLFGNQQLVLMFLWFHIDTYYFHHGDPWFLLISGVSESQLASVYQHFFSVLKYPHILVT